MIKLFTKTYETFAVKNRFLQKLCELYYKPMVKKEIASAKIQEADKVLFIGGGPLPMSALLTAHYTSASITIVDCDQNALNNSKQFLSKYNYPIELINAKGEYLSTEDYSVIIIAKQVIPKECVLKNILKQSRPSTRILYRSNHQILPSYHKITKKGSLCLIVTS